MIITQTFTMARWQIVVKTSEATKQTKNQNDNNKTNKQKKNNNNKTGGGAGVEKQLNEWSSDVIIIDLRETERGRGLTRVLLRLYPKQILADITGFTSGSVWRKKFVDYSKYFLISF